MKLPNLDEAIIPREKIVDYLLSKTHKDGRGKAEFFLQYGFSAESWEILAAALKKHAETYEVNKTELSPFGMRYIIEGGILAPDKNMPFIRAVWFVDTGMSTPRFVTAYPQRMKDND